MEEIINKLYPKFKPLKKPLNNNGLLLLPMKIDKNREAIKG